MSQIYHTQLFSLYYVEVNTVVPGSSSHPFWEVVLATPGDHYRQVKLGNTMIVATTVMGLLESGTTVWIKGQK